MSEVRMRGDRRKILIVEDETLLALSLSLSLQEEGHIITGCVTSGEKALAMIEKDRPDIVLIDIKLDGGMDGIETSWRIRREHALPIVFMTGNTDHGTLQLANELDPVGILRKPINDHEVLSVIRKAFA